MEKEMKRNFFNEDRTRREKPMERFWQRETPETCEENRLIFSLYKDAGKLQIARFFGYDRWEKITIDRRAITPEMAEILKKFIDLEVEKEGK